jgi:hypothetical protein
MFDDLQLRRSDLGNGHSGSVFNETSQIVRVARFSHHSFDVSGKICTFFPSWVGGDFFTPFYKNPERIFHFQLRVSISG